MLSHPRLGMGRVPTRMGMRPVELLDATAKVGSTNQQTGTGPRVARAPSLRLKEFKIEKNTPIVLIGGGTYSACAQSLMNLGFNVINKAMIDHPARGHQLRFREKHGYTLRRASRLLSLSR
jgi:hypothetical protein